MNEGLDSIETKPPVSGQARKLGTLITHTVVAIKRQTKSHEMYFILYILFRSKLDYNNRLLFA